MDLVETAAYGANTPAWHQKGLVFPGFATTPEILRLGKVDWLVEKQPVFLGSGVAVPSHFAIVRVPDQKLLGMVKGRYQPIQNHMGFEFCDFLLAEKQARWEAAMSLRGGSQVVGLLELTESGVEIRKGDKHYHYITVLLSHDGTSAVRIFPTDVRVVCANTLALAMGSRDAALTMNIRHTGNIMDKAQQTVAMLASVSEEFKAHEEWMRHLVEIPLTQNRFKEVLAELFPEGEDETPRIKANRDARILALTEGVREEVRLLPQLSFTTIQQNATAYELFNGVTRYVDHFIGNKKKDRFEYAVVGSGADFKNKAIDVINNVFAVAA